MILMNYISAKEMKRMKIGIYWSAKYNNLKEYIPPDSATKGVKKFLKMWRSSGGSYVKYENIEGHEILDLDAYVHITSPIRRLVDLLNILQFQHTIDIVKLNENDKIYQYKFKYLCYKNQINIYHNLNKYNEIYHRLI